ncbi:hypothetical protein [Streptomyces sp. RFCAC02]|uniref:hypothetical protein n=1 Tax=Streptomyces sp. RFCAC02 TaxID=2499143 RepID=UPI001F0F8CCF|nr:hypothetical protein [Streptomyces sp. RFCAC02]
MTTPDLTTLPATTWEDPAPAVPLLYPAQAGVHLGTDRQGRAVALPAPGPAGIRIAVLGESLFGRLFALRLLAVGACVTAATRAPAQWAGIRQAAGDRLVIAGHTGAWPPQPAAPPTVDSGPQALVCDLRRAPHTALAAGPWRTVVHVTRTAPRRSAFWAAAEAVLALDAQFADAVEQVLGTDAARVAAGLTPGEIVVFHRGGGCDVLRPDISPGETALLTPGRPPA